VKLAKTGALIAVAAGGLFAAACKKDEPAADTPPTAAPAADGAAGAAATKPGEPEHVAQVDCYGVNACKGQSTCKTDKHGCGGQNECKGQGVLPMTEAECDDKGGKVTARHE
jgi:hypothetical protein